MFCPPAGVSIRSGMSHGISGEAIQDACAAGCPCRVGLPIRMFGFPVIDAASFIAVRLQYPYDRIIITPAGFQIFPQKNSLSGTGIWPSLCMGAIFPLYSFWIFFHVYGYGFSSCVYIYNLLHEGLRCVSGSTGKPQKNRAKNLIKFGFGHVIWGSAVQVIQIDYIRLVEINQH